MRVKRTLLGVAVALMALATPVYAQQQPATAAVAGELIVRFVPGSSANARAEAHRQAGAAERAAIARTNAHLVRVMPGNETAAIARYRANPNVISVEPNYVRSIPPSSVTSANVIPGDFLFAEQYALNNTGQQFVCVAPDFCLFVGTADADIDAPEAWALTTGDPNVKVAVIDSGIDYTHPDLAANYAGGYDFMSNDDDPMDDHGHGTHVSGTIAALMNNLTGSPGAEEGVVGVAPDSRILAYKACDASGSCNDFAIQQAIAKAIDDGARVINLSLGSANYSESLDDAIQVAWNAGLVIVSAAGNNGVTTPFYPAALPNVVSVAAFDEDHRRAGFSNYGAWVDISAPGNWVLSTYPMAACSGAATQPGDLGCYSWNSGTSMASPHVAGAAALLLSRPGMTAAEAVDLLLQGADPMGVDAIALNTWTIHGGLNLHQSLSLGFQNVPPVANAGPDQTVTDSDNNGSELVALDGTGSSDADGDVATYDWRIGNTSIAVGATPDVFLNVGVHTITLHVSDDAGATANDSVTITVTPGNAAPVAANKTATTTAGTPVTVMLSATDTAQCDLTFAIVQSPAAGSLGSLSAQPCVAGSPNSDTAQVTYTPPATAGTYTFTYKANDGSADSNTATVTVTVNPAPSLSVTSVNPSSVSLNAGTVTLQVYGTNFANGATVSFVNGSAGQAPRVLNVSRVSATQLTVTAEIRTGGPKRPRTWDVRVTNPGGASATGAGLLTITP